MPFQLCTPAIVGSSDPTTGPSAVVRCSPTRSDGTWVQPPSSSSVPSAIARPPPHGLMVRSINFDVGIANHPGPLARLVIDELCERGAGCAAGLQANVEQLLLDGGVLQCPQDGVFEPYRHLAGR